MWSQGLSAGPAANEVQSKPEAGKRQDHVSSMQPCFEVMLLHMMPLLQQGSIQFLIAACSKWLCR